MKLTALLVSCVTSLVLQQPFVRVSENQPALDGLDVDPNHAEHTLTGPAALPCSCQMERAWHRVHPANSGTVLGQIYSHPNLTIVSGMIRDRPIIEELLQTTKDITVLAPVGLPESRADG